MVLLQLKDSFELSVKRREFFPVLGFYIVVIRPKLLKVT